jgi:hypothetical protein
MRRAFFPTALTAALALVPWIGVAQGQAMDASKAVAGGGISVTGWMGQVDASQARRGLSVESAKLTKEGDALHVVTGPQIVYWNPANTASGDYTVKATFTEPQFMNLNSHDHPYGIAIGGNDMGTPQATYLYCATYGSGKFIVRGFGPAAFQMNGGEGEANAAIHKAAAKGEKVTQEIAMSVKGDKVTCSVNGTVVGTYSKAELVGPGKLKSLDGVYGIRFAHNTEGTVTGLTKTTP